MFVTKMFVTKPAIVPAGESLSAIVDCSETGSGPGVLAAIIMPDGIGGEVTFRVSFDNRDYYDLIGSDGDELILPLTAGTVVAVSSDVARSVQYLRIRTGTSDRPVEQPEERLFQVVVVGG